VADAARYTAFADELVGFGMHASPMGRLIEELLAEKRRTSIERVFRGLGILHPRAGLRSAHDAIVHGDEARRGTAREILETIVSPELRVTLLAVLDDMPPGQRRTRLGRLAPGPFASYEALVAALLADPSESLRCVVAYHVGEQHLVALRAELGRLRPSIDRSFVIHAFDQAIERLDG
jgi:hypothetical protein